MNDILKLLEKKQIDRSFSAIGLDFNKLFPEESREKINIAYGDHEWIVKTVETIGTVINAVPSDENIDMLPWEEWFMLNGKLTHHVLFINKPDIYDEIFEAPDQDDVHPPRTLGRKWFVIDDKDMNPVLLR